MVLGIKAETLSRMRQASTEEDLTKSFFLWCWSLERYISARKLERSLKAKPERTRIYSLAKPTIVYEISIDEWKRALEASDTEVENWLIALLKERGITPTVNATKFISQYIKLWVEYEIAERGCEFSDNVKDMLYRLFARIAYDFHRVSK